VALSNPTREASFSTDIKTLTHIIMLYKGISPYSWTPYVQSDRFSHCFWWLMSTGIALALFHSQTLPGIHMYWFIATDDRNKTLKNETSTMHMNFEFKMW